MASVDHRISAHPHDLVIFKPIASSSGPGKVLPILRENSHAIEKTKFESSTGGQVSKSKTRWLPEACRSAGRELLRLCPLYTCKRILKVDVAISAKIERDVVQICKPS
jgi:hypothetical protein